MAQVVIGSNFHVPFGDLLSHNVNNINNTNNYYYTKNLDGFLSPLDPERRHITIRDKRTKGTGEWLLQSKEFRDWHGSTCRRVLCCKGDPGIGKTYIACHVIQTLRQEENSAVGFVYCDHHDRERHTARNILGALLSQIRSHLNPESDIVVQLRSRSQHNNTLSYDDTTEFLSKAVLRIPKTVRFCLDALDEVDPMELDNLLRSFARVCQAPNVCIFLTGRCNAGIEDVINRRLASAISVAFLSISTPQTCPDIKRFLIQKLGHDRHPELVDNDLSLVQGRESTFLLASLKIETLLKKLTKRERRECLDAKTRNLEETYERMLERVKNEEEGYGMKILQWITFSMRPLNLEELRYALAMRLNTKAFDPSEDLPPDSVVNSTLGLVTVDDPDRYGGIGNQVVRFVHFTLKEHLVANSRLHFPTGHTLLAEATLTYLSQSFIKRLAVNSFPCFFDYAVKNWGRHAHEGEDEKLVHHIYNFLRSENFHVIRKRHWWFLDARHYSSPLHAISHFGLPSTLRRALSFKSDMVADLNIKDPSDQTPLFYSVRTGNAEVVEVLLQQEGLDLNLGGRYGQTPLLFAIEKGNMEIVKLLLHREDLNVNSVDQYGRTPLSHAAEQGRVEVVKLLLERGDLDINLADEDNRTALFFATERGKVEVVELFFEREDLEVNLADLHGRSVLSYAAGRGRVEIIRLLLQREDLDINLTDWYGRSPFSYAATQGNVEVVELLFEREDLNVNLADKDNRTPLFFAAENRRAKVVKLLFEREDLDVNLADWRGQCVLLYAAQGGVEVVRLLLRRKDLDVNVVNRYSEIALLYAAGQGRVEVVKLLLEREGFDINVVDQYSQTVLVLAALRGDAKIVQLLLAKENIDINIADYSGRTALFYAMERGSLEIMKLLLERDDIDVKLVDRYGRTALSHAENLMSLGVGHYGGH